MNYDLFNMYNKQWEFHYLQWFYDFVVLYSVLKMLIFFGFDFHSIKKISVACRLSVSIIYNDVCGLP